MNDFLPELFNMSGKKSHSCGWSFRLPTTFGQQASDRLLLKVKRLTLSMNFAFNLGHYNLAIDFRKTEHVIEIFKIDFACKK